MNKRACAACRLAKCFQIGLRYENFPTRNKTAKKRTNAEMNNEQSPATTNSTKDDDDTESGGYGGDKGIDAFFDLTSTNFEGSLNQQCQQPPPPPPAQTSDIVPVVNGQTSSNQSVTLYKQPSMFPFGDELVQKSVQALNELAAFNTVCLIYDLYLQLKDFPFLSCIVASSTADQYSSG